MKHLATFATALLTATALMAQTATTKKTFTLDDLMPGGATFWQLQPETMFTTWWGDVAVETTVDNVTVIRPDGRRGQVLTTADDLNAIAGETLVRSCHHLTFPYPDRPVVKVQTPRSITLLDFKARRITSQQEIAEGATEVTWSPASHCIAYCKGSDVYVQRADGTRVRITSDGSDDIVYGHSVSRDEFGITRGLFWSPDGTRLAFYRKDQSRIPSYPQVDITQRIAATYVDKYPMAGCESEDVSVGIYNVEADTTLFLHNPKPQTDYMTNLSWAPDSRTIYVFELNRDQDHMQLFSYETDHGYKATEPMLEEHHEKYVEPLHGLTFLPWDATKAILQSRRDGWNHLYLLDTARDGALTQLTRGEWEVKQLLGFCERDRSIVFTANATHPLRATIHSIGVNGKGLMRMLGADDGVHTPSLSATGSMLIDSYTSPTVARSIGITDVHKGRTANLLTAADPWEAYEAPEITSGSIKAADGVTDLYYRLVKPTHFDPARKYPAIVYVYGGPHAHNIQASRGYYFRGWEIYMAQLGYVVFVLDNRGSEYRGRDFEQATFRHLGVEEMRDQMCGVDFLRSLPYVDADRMGVHGWSFGGFMTINLMCTYPDVFKVGVAGGPVVDWKYYEVMYGERYMDTPEQNPDGYAACSLLPKAGQLKGRLQIILGYNDPTCVPQHTLSFVRAAIDAGTQPDLFLYPGDGHNMFGRDQVHLHERITRYFLDYLPPTR